MKKLMVLRKIKDGKFRTFLFSCILSILAIICCHAQSNETIKGDSTTNALDFEPLGNLVAYDISYERKIFDLGKGFDIRADVGGMFFPFIIEDFAEFRSVGASVGAKVVYSFGSNAFLAGLDYNYIFLYDSRFPTLFPNRDMNLFLFNFGYRYQFKNSPVFLGLSVYGIAALDANETGEVYSPVFLFPIPGLSVGYRL